MKMISRPFSFLIAGCLVFNSHALAAQDAASIPSEVYYPPPGGNEQQALTRMRAEVPELQGAHGRGKPDDYLRVVLRAFRGNTKDLAEFFRWSYRPTGSAFGGELTNDVTLGLLYQWGDQRFAAVLTEQAPEVRRGVGKHFWLQKPGDDSAFIKGFPATAKAALLVRHPST